MSVYIEFLKKSFQKNYIYRANSYITILSSILFLFVQISVWHALMGNDNVNGIDYYDMINYVIINMIVQSLVRSEIAQTLADKVNNGSIASDLLKPINLKLYLIADQFGKNIFSTIFNTLPVCLVSVTFLKFQLPDSAGTFIYFIVSFIFGITLMIHIHYIMGLLSFWLKTAFYVNWFLGASFELFGGTFVPLWFYPDLLYKISNALPFHLVSFQPIAIFTGKLSYAEANQVIILQITWILALILLEKLIWSKAQKKIVVYGG